MGEIDKAKADLEKLLELKINFPERAARRPSCWNCGRKLPASPPNRPDPMVTRAWVLKLLAAARQARVALMPLIPGFQVGAAVLTAAGEIFTGCNVENVSFGATVCAERVALWTAVAAGRRRIEALAVLAATPDPVAPCGLCRQVVAEFNPACLIIMGNLAGKVEISELGALFPHPFAALPPISVPSFCA